MDGNDIKPAGACGMFRVGEQETLCRMDDPALFAGVDALQGADQPSAGALAHFDEYQRCAVQHDQVELAAAHIEVARKQLEFALLQVLKCGLLGSLSCDLA